MPALTCPVVRQFTEEIPLTAPFDEVLQTLTVSALFRAKEPLKRSELYNKKLLLHAYTPPYALLGLYNIHSPPMLELGTSHPTTRLSPITFEYSFTLRIPLRLV
jgi:hypothetical protein